ncbi:hypothetical protein GCM10010275_39600 [Streptomyces litmocidini]|nr:hypothetical protein GCM10010275_39600 [Streptomyces litmocidini]
MDLSLPANAPTQRARPSGERVGSPTSHTKIDGARHSTPHQTHVLNAGTTRSTNGVTLQLGEGRMSDDLRSPMPKRTIQFDVMTEGQAALHTPAPTSVPSRSKEPPPWSPTTPAAPRAPGPVRRRTAPWADRSETPAGQRSAVPAPGRIRRRSPLPVRPAAPQETRRAAARTARHPSRSPSSLSIA